MSGYLLIPGEKYPEPLIPHNDLNGHIFATCWLKNENADKRIDGKKDYIRTYLCIRCKMELVSVTWGSRSERIPDTVPLTTCDEHKAQTIVDI